SRPHRMWWRCFDQLGADRGAAILDYGRRAGTPAQPQQPGLRPPGATRMTCQPGSLSAVLPGAPIAARARLRALGLLGSLAIALALPGLVAAQSSCPRAGDLDPRYCDVDGDLIADTPADKADQKDPSTLIFSFTPVEDRAVYEGAFSDF